MVNTQSSPGGQSSPSEPDTSSRTGQEASQIPQDVSAELNLSSEPEIPMRLHLEAWVKRWQFHDALTRWAVWALNVPNQPPGYLHNNIFVTELTLNKNPSHSEDMFTCGPVPVVQDRNELARCFYNHKISKDEINWCAHGRWDNDKVQVCVIYDSIVAHHEGTYHRGAPELNPDGRLIHLVPKLYNAFCETLSMFYRPHLWSAIQMNDPALTDQFVETILHRTYGLWSYSLIQTPESHRFERTTYNPLQALRRAQGESREEVFIENAEVLGDRMLRSITMPFKLGESTQHIRETLQHKFPDAFPLPPSTAI